ncbi:hypothetical protein BUALT_Bualt03G0173600 [Buddleja alternifolia]|uniref:Uncharacterized protein n=1 Tax=Buddleja alternifolia TaxID=168488 RepID=A0AAV6Y1W5_9LAMI|nr:hypothetical protein BUALT_Bualt03G0173600 [Buddleja alternifolia]
MYRNHDGKVVFRDEILEKDDHKPKSSGLKDGGMVVLGAGAAVAATVATAALRRLPSTANGTTFWPRTPQC